MNGVERIHPIAHRRDHQRLRGVRENNDPPGANMVSAGVELSCESSACACRTINAHRSVYSITSMLLSSDPHAWLRPYFATLKADPAYQTLAVPLRFRALCDVVAVEHAERAAWMRQWSPAGQEARLTQLSSIYRICGSLTRAKLRAPRRHS